MTYNVETKFFENTYIGDISLRGREISQGEIQADVETVLDVSMVDIYHCQCGATFPGPDYGISGDTTVPQFRTCANGHDHIVYFNR